MARRTPYSASLRVSVWRYSVVPPPAPTSSSTRQSSHQGHDATNDIQSSMKPRRARACASTVKYNHTHRHASECSAYGLSATLFPRYSPHMIPGGSLSPLTTLTLYIRATHTHYRRASCRQGRPQRGEPKQTLSCVSAVCSAKADVAAEVGALVWPLPASCRRRLLIAHTSART